MSEDDLLMKNGEVKDSEEDSEKEKQPNLLDRTVIYNVDDESDIEYTGWINDYQDDEDVAQYYLSIQAMKEGNMERFALFFKKNFRPYFREAVERYRDEQGGKE